MNITCLDGVFEHRNSIDIRKTITSGQTFRWCAAHDGVLNGVVGYGERERRISLYQSGQELFASVDLAEFSGFWAEYFDLDTDYGELYKFAKYDEFLKEAIEYGEGLRVLKQCFWETLISFILSQRSNIPRIETCIKSLTGIFGHFPAPDDILSSERLDEVRCGYRLPYLKFAAEYHKLHYTGDLFDISYEEAKTSLKTIKGVGDKVADCVILFGLHNRRAFPVDVWIGRILEKFYPNGLAPAQYGKFAGIVQQYMFYYAINHKDKLRMM